MQLQIRRVRLPLLCGALWLLTGSPGLAAQEMSDSSSGMQMGSMSADGWRMPPSDFPMMMLPGMEGRRPTVTPFLPGSGLSEEERRALPAAVEGRTVALEDGGRLELTAGLARWTIGDRPVVAYAFNGQIPGPRLSVPQGATITVVFENETEIPLTLRWHGVRLENEYDGVPGLTQRPVDPGERFEYRVRFPDPGVFWYHPHQNEAKGQDLGLYGNIVVEPEEPEYYDPANREAVLILDDFLMDDLGPLPWGLEAPNHTFMGRFGNLLLVNGRTQYEGSVKQGAVVRYHLTNASNTRTYHLVFEDTPLKLVAGDLSRYERQQWVDGVVIGPGQRYTVEARFAEPGEVAITNRIQAVDHFRGIFVPQVQRLGTVVVEDDAVEADHAATFERLREHVAVQEELEALRPHFDRPPDGELHVELRVEDVPLPVRMMLEADTVYVPPLEWNDAMPMMNWVSTANEVTWILADARDIAAGREVGPAVGWRFREGQIAKIRIFNDPKNLHPMHHPLHMHGQRFLLLEQDGIRSRNMAWRDTAIIPVGSTVDLLVEMSNPGSWMFNCQIPEHLEAGMSMVFQVVEARR